MLLSTSLRVLQIVSDIFHRLVHLLVAADVQLDDLHAIRVKFLQLLCTLSSFLLQR